MKLSKTSWLILGIGILAIGVGGLYMLYSQQRQEQQRLDDRLAVAQMTLPTLVSEKEDSERQLTQLKNQLARLETELTQAGSLLAEAAMSFPDSVESIEYGEALFQIADDLEITRITTSPPTYKEVEGVTLSVGSFMVNVVGDVADILDFIDTIATHEDFLSTTVELVNIDIQEPPLEGEQEGLAEEAKSSAIVRLTVYGHTGE